MELVSVEQFLYRLAQGLSPNYLDLLNNLSFTDCSKEIFSLINEKCDPCIGSPDPLLSCLVLNFSRQANLALLTNEELGNGIVNLKAQNASILQELRTVSKKAMRYLDDLHSAESDLCSYREELFRLRSERSVLPQSHATPHSRSPVTIPSPLLTSFQQGAIGSQVCGTAVCPNTGLTPDLDDQRTSPKSLNCVAMETPFDHVPSFSPSDAVGSNSGPMYTPPVHIGEDYGSKNGHHSFFGMAGRSSHHEQGKGESKRDSGYSDQQSSSGSDRDLSVYSGRDSSHPSDRDLSVYSSRDSSHPSDRSISISPPRRREHKAHSPTFLSEPERKSKDCHAFSPSCQEHDDHLPTLVSQPDRGRQAECEPHSSFKISVSPSPSYRQTSETTDGLRLKQLECIAKDINCFNHGNSDFNIESYLREVNDALSDLPRATQREKLKLLWKTSSREVHVFIGTQPSSIRNSYSELCKALVAEYLPRFDEATAMIQAIAIKHGRTERPREYYKRLKYAFFQGRDGPGLEDQQAFKSLFLHNLHPCIRTHVVLFSRDKHSMLDIRNEAQIAWETLRIMPASERIKDHQNTPDNSLGTSQCAPAQHNNSKCKKSFYPRGYQGRFSRSNTSRNWREDRPGNPKGTPDQESA